MTPLKPFLRQNSYIWEPNKPLGYQFDIDGANRFLTKSNTHSPVNRVCLLPLLPAQGVFYLYTAAQTRPRQYHFFYVVFRQLSIWGYFSGVRTVHGITTDETRVTTTEHPGLSRPVTLAAETT